jgi:hypothetical protein
VHVRPDRGSRHAGIEQPKLPSHRLCQEWRDIGAEALDRPALEAALGGIEWRPLDHGVRETVERFRALVRR